MRTASLFSNCITSSASYFSWWFTVRNIADLFYSSDLARKIYSRVWEPTFEKFDILCHLMWYINLIWSSLWCFEHLAWVAWVQASPSLLEHFVEVLARDFWVLGFTAPSGSGTGLHEVCMEKLLSLCLRGTRTRCGRVRAVKFGTKLRNASWTVASAS